jgi:hypothetical protein
MFLELFNSLFISFVISEVIVRKQHVYHDLRGPIIVAVGLNFVLVEWAQLGDGQWLRQLGKVAASPFAFISHNLGSG